MTWADFYLLCFLVGFLLSAISFFSSHPHTHAHGGHVNGGHGHSHAHLHAHNAESTFSFFNFATGSAFLAWFGGAGFLLTRYASMWVWAALAVAVLFGLAGAGLVFWFVAKFLLKHERDLDPADYEMIGVLGRLSSPIREGGVGEMIFSRAGGRRVSAARSEDGRAIPRDTEVVVTRYESGIAYVRRWDELLNE
jgi:membrane protein implicated in regulation of membrane protease activity